jgi:hypothetical protein
MWAPSENDLKEVSATPDAGKQTESSERAVDGKTKAPER